MKIVLTKGLPSSGKSTWAKELIAKEPGQWKRVNKDELRAMLDNGKWSKANEKFVVSVRDAIVIDALKKGLNVIVDDTNLHSVHYDRMVEISKMPNIFPSPVEVEIKDFTDVSLEECLLRDQKRPNYVGEKVIKRFYRQFIQKKAEKPALDPKLRNVIICDLDGTLALFGDNNPYDRNFEEDLPNPAVVELVKSYVEKEAVIFVSGRKEKYRMQTLNWLSKHLGGFAPLLFMRKDEDNRQDSIIKQEIYDAHIKGLYNILFVLDDRDQVVEFWRSLGLTCLQVDYGDF